MICEHLRDLELAIASAGIDETCRGQPWSQNCREWVYYDCLLDMAAIRDSFDFTPCVVDHRNDDPRSGLEAGFVCEQCHDAIMGVHPQNGKGRRVFTGAKN
jgi:hypothetical protein